MRKLFVILIVFFAVAARAQVLPYIEASYTETLSSNPIPLNVPLKGHYVFAEAKQHTLGIMELGTIMSFRSDSTVSMKLVGYGALVIDVEATYKLSPGQVLTFQMISVSNPVLSEQLIHFFEVPIYYSVLPIQNNVGKGHFVVLSGEHAMKEYKKGMQQEKTGFQFTLSCLK